MSRNLPAPSAAGALPAFPRVLPGAVRAKARENLLGDLGTLQVIIDDPEEKGAVRVSAVKLKAAIGGVLSSASVPRDVVEEKITDTAQYLRRHFGDEAFAAIADDLTAIWDI